MNETRRGKHLRLWWRFAIQAAVREMHYRANLVTTIGLGIVQLVLALIPVLVLFEYTGDIRGWNRAETLALVGLYQVVSGLMATFILPNVDRVSEYIVRGNLDAVLLRPVSSQFYVSFRWINLAALGNVATGLALLVFGLVRAEADPSPTQVLQAVLLLLSGIVLLTCAWSAAMYLAFWTQKIGGMTMLFYGIIEAGRYPMAFFPTAVRMFLTFAVPVAFTASLPVEALSDGVGWTPVIGGAVFAVLGVLLLRAFWRLGLRSYASASS